MVDLNFATGFWWHDIRATKIIIEAHKRLDPGDHFETNIVLVQLRLGLCSVVKRLNQVQFLTRVSRLYCLVHVRPLRNIYS